VLLLFDNMYYALVARCKMVLGFAMCIKTHVGKYRYVILKTVTNSIFSLCLLTWKTLHTAHPPYLSELITHYLQSGRALRSSNTNFLARPTGITRNFTSRAFSVSAPSTWNSLPTNVRSLDKLSTFKRQLKSHIFQFAFAA